MSGPLYRVERRQRRGHKRETLPTMTFKNLMAKSVEFHHYTFDIFDFVRIIYLFYFFEWLRRLSGTCLMGFRLQGNFPNRTVKTPGDTLHLKKRIFVYIIVL